MTSATQHRTFLDRALADGHAEISGEGRNEGIHYGAAFHSERWADPEGKVRAELWAELIYKYEYAPELIGPELLKATPGRWFKFSYFGWKEPGRQKELSARRPSTNRMTIRVVVKAIRQGRWRRRMAR